MPTLRLRITVPDRIWIGELSREYGDAEFDILTAFPKDLGAVALAEITALDCDDIVRELEQYEAVPEIDVLNRTEETVLVQFETSEPILLLPVKEAGTPLELPFVVSDGTVDWEITASQDRLSKLTRQLHEFEITFDILSITHEVETRQLLTDRQREILYHAVETGYYDTPRENTLTGLAADLELAKSTCSDILHRAEEKVVKEFTADIASIDTGEIGAADRN